MRVLIQRVSSAAVKIRGITEASIEHGALLLIAIQRGDTRESVRWMAGKVARLRMFDDAAGRMNASIDEVGGDYLAVSQFTLYADCRKGNRPSYMEAAPPDEAEPLYQDMINELKALGHRVESGVFRERMDVHLCNDGPVTFMLESPSP